MRNYLLILLLILFSCDNDSNLLGVPDGENINQELIEYDDYTYHQRNEYFFTADLDALTAIFTELSLNGDVFDTYGYLDSFRWDWDYFYNSEGDRFFKLESIEFDGTNITDEQLSLILNFQNLQELTLDNEYNVTILPDLSSFTNLDYLDLYNLNDLISISVLPENILYLNIINCNDLIEIDASVFELESLRSLFLHDLSELNFSLSWISGLSDLLTLSIDNVNLTDNIPEDLSGLEDLTKFSIENTNLSGTIPSSIADLEDLVWIDLENNNLSGVIPDVWATLDNLEEIDLSHNYLDGTIPESIFVSSNNIRYIRLDNNNLSGDIPDAVCTFIEENVSYYDLHLNTNAFCEYIPSCITYYMEDQACDE